MLEIRNATEDDLAGITNLWLGMMKVQRDLAERYRLAEGAEDLFQAAARNKLNRDNNLTLVAWKDGRRLGFCFARIEKFASVFTADRYCLISDLAVDPEARRLGVGRQLFGAVRTWAAREGVNRYEVNVAKGNEPAEAFWEREGFGVVNAKHEFVDNG